MSYRELVLMQRPDFYLPLEESGGGSAADITGNGFDGTYNNVLMSSQSGFSVFGGPATYAQWNGSSSSVSIPKLWQRGGAFSVSAWLKPSSLSGWRQLFHLSNAIHNNAGPALYVSTGGTSKAMVMGRPWNGTQISAESSAAVFQEGVIAHAALVARGPVATAYVNGQAVVSYTNATGPFAPPSATMPLRIGAGHAASTTLTDFFAGWISNFAAFGRPLSAAEVLRQYQVGKQVFDQPYVSGTVLDNGAGVSKRIKWIRRDSGLLVSACSSQADGTFVMKTTADVGMAVCLDDEVSAYPALIFDRVTPQV